jgi:polyphosphate kinase 2 (PPK2 family)
MTNKKKHDYEHALKELQKQLSRLQQAYSRQGRRAIVALEGWDAAGKGGLIRRIGWVLDPRHLKVWSTLAPEGVERRQHWLQRFWQRVPLEGELAVFDRTWYGRVLVERVEGFASEDEWTRAYVEINEFERVLAAEGIRIIKLFLDISRKTQLERFVERFQDPDKRWKITEDDIRNRARWHDYERAYTDMLAKTSTEHAPWRRIDANHKHASRIACLEAITEALGRGVDVTPPDVPPVVRAFLEEHLEQED